MNEPTPGQFSVLVEEIVLPIAATARRKQAMREELLLHLTESQLHTLKQSGDEHAATEAAMARFGDTADIRRQLQASVPLLERTFHHVIGQKETSMSRILWIVSIAAIVIGTNFTFPLREEVHLAGVGLLVAMILRHLCQPQNLAARLLGPQWRWMVGIAGVLLGPSLILPATAKIVRDQIYHPAFFIALGLGVLILLSGVGFVVSAISSRRARIA